MYNLLLIEEDLQQMKIIINYIGKKFNNIRIVNVSYELEECIELLKANDIDIIVLDSVYNKNTESELIKYIEKNNLYQYKKSIIVKTNKLKHKLNDKFNQYVLSYIDNIEEIEYVLELITNKEIKKINLEQVKKQIHKELNEINYNYSYKGTKYLEETILEIYKKNLAFEGNLEKEIYPIIANKYKKKIETIYGNIKFATNHMLLECKEEKLIEYLGYDFYEKPKIKEIIYKILNNLKSNKKIETKL